MQDSYQELMRRFEENKKKSAEFSEELVPDEKKVLSMEKVRERRHKTGGGLHRLGKVVGMAVVAVACVFAASMTSEANRTYLVNSVRIWSGDDTKLMMDNDNSNEKANIDEEVAIADIEEKLGVKVPEFYYRPYGFEFLDYTIDDLTSLAWIEYEYKTNRIMLLIDKQNIDKASRIQSAHGSEKELTVVNNDGISAKIKQVYDNDEGMESCSAEWNRNGVEYTLFGKIELEEIKKIVEKMIF